MELFLRRYVMCNRGLSLNFYRSPVYIFFAMNTKCNSLGIQIDLCNMSLSTGEYLRAGLSRDSLIKTVLKIRRNTIYSDKRTYTKERYIDDGLSICANNVFVLSVYYNVCVFSYSSL
jgi:hypothetical protein